MGSGEGGGGQDVSGKGEKIGVLDDDFDEDCCGLMDERKEMTRGG